MTKEIDNRFRPVPDEPHPDMSGRVGFVYNTYPKPGGPRIADEIERNKGYIRGGRAEVHFNALKPYLESRNSDKRVEPKTGSIKF